MNEHCIHFAIETKTGLIIAFYPLYERTGRINISFYCNSDE